MNDYVEVPIDGVVVEKLMKLTKKELAEKFIVAALDAEVSKKELTRTKDKLTQAEAFVEQGRVMVEAVMERWHEYDV